MGGEASPPALAAIIADDEPGARRHLGGLLERCGVRLVGECATGGAVLEALAGPAPDLLCLDVRLPDLDGVEVARRLSVGRWPVGRRPVVRRPVVVFATAYGEYAAAAFDLDAADYLVKPFTAARVAEAVRRVRARLAEDGLPAGEPHGGSNRGWTGATPTERVARLFIPHDDHRVALAPEAIVYVEARDGLSIIHADDGAHLLPVPLARLEGLLAPHGFLRTHRAYLVNLRRARALVPWSRHAHTLLLEGGQETHVPVAKSRLAAFRGSVIWIPHVRGGRDGPGTARQGRDRIRCEPRPGAGDRRGPGR